MGQLHRTVAAVFVAALVLSGCKPAEPPRRDQESPNGRAGQKQPLRLFEAALNPSDFDHEVEELARSLKGERVAPDAESEADSVTIEIEQRLGFRIQIFATNNIDEANSMRAIASQGLAEDSVYVVFDPPVYKVRVGDFPTRIEASRKLPEIARSGFPDAWVVADRILVRKLIRVQPER